jgi:hypothetical protein
MNTFNTSDLKRLLTQIEETIPHFEEINPSISNSNIGWHIEHSLMVFNGITDTLSSSNPNEYKWTFNFKRLVVFTRRKIPRGIAKAPKSVVPKMDYTKESLFAHVEKAKVKLEEIKQLDSKQFFNHPGFGNIRLKQTVRFLEIHTKHHLDIIHDIEKMNHPAHR